MLPLRASDHGPVRFGTDQAATSAEYRRSLHGDLADLAEIKRRRRQIERLARRNRRLIAQAWADQPAHRRPA